MAPTADTLSDTLTITDAKPDGYCSLKLTLSDGREVFALAAGGGSNSENQKNRDVLFDALLQTIVHKEK